MMMSMRLVSLMSLAAMVSLVPTAKADEWDKKTVLTVSETIQLPNVTLQPGTYVFKLLNSQSDRHIVQVFDQNDQHLITTILAIPNYRLQPTGKSKFTFWETPAGQPPAMRAWFYPGDNFGQEFAYPKNMSTQIAANAKAAVPTTEATSADQYKSAEVSSTTENGSTSTLDQNTYTAPTPAPTPAPTVAEAPAPPQQEAAVVTPAPEPAPQPEAAPAQLPQTASSIPLIGLIGLVSMLSFVALRAKRIS